MASTNSVLTTVLPNVDLEGSSSHMPNIAYNNVSEIYVEFSEQNENSEQGWNLSKATVASLPEKLPIPVNASSTTVYTTTMSNSFDEFGPPEGVEYIFVPLGVVVFVIILSAVVLIVSRKRKLEKLRHRLMPMYNFDPGEEEDDDWETELLDELDHQRRQGYQTMDVEENAELFSAH